MIAATTSARAKSAPALARACFDPQTVGRVNKQMPSDEDVANLENMFDALRDPTRIRILFALCRGKELCVNDLAALLDMTASAVSHQLRKLRDRQMVKCRWDKNLAYYSLGDDPCIRKLLEFGLCLARETAEGGRKGARK